MKKETQTKIHEQAELFGLENRMLQCTEECGELIQALCKCKRVLSGDKTCQIHNMQYIEHMISEEIADVEICIEQIKYLLKNYEKVEHIKQNKIQRTEERMQGNKQAKDLRDREQFFIEGIIW